jgi:hypothetical protein
MKNKVSPEVEAKSLQIAKGTQKPGQTKEQTKLIAQGIEKGIAEYKKQQGKKLRELDKRRKKNTNSESSSKAGSSEAVQDVQVAKPLWLPWGLLALTWIGIGIFFTI